jgi:hypothetical protein
VVYGDSLTSQTTNELRSRLGLLLPDWDIVIRAHGGTAQCDWNPSMAQDADTLNVKAVVIQFSGNRSTACISGLDAVEKYTEDANWAVDLWRSEGVPLAFVAGPGRVGIAPADHEIGNVYRSVAGARDVLVVDPAPLFVDLTTGLYAQEMPCLVGECAGTIPVRAPDGAHFCPEPGSAIPGGCSVYSSGVVRFAEAIVHGVATLVGVPQPPYRTMVPTSTVPTSTPSSTAPATTTSSTTSTTVTTSP